MSIRSRLILSAVAALLAIPALAQTDAVRIRGKISAMDDGSITVAAREGRALKVTLDSETRFSYPKALELSAIAAGSYIGTAGKPAKDGSIEALEVVVFPEEARGTGEGHRPWDLLPDSSMTNATVAAVVESTSARELNLTYKGGKQKIKVAANTPVVTMLPAKKSDLKVGETVFIVATPKESGEFAASRVVVSKNGVVPPM